MTRSVSLGSAGSYVNVSICFQVRPIVADDRRRVFGNGALIGLVIVLAGEVDDVERQLFRAGAVDTEVIPVGLAIAAVLVLFPFRPEAEVSLRDLLDAAQAAAFEIRVHRDGRGEPRGPGRSGTAWAR